jgi:raffinose/stachyose/melibiose transport system permease protein
MFRPVNLKSSGGKPGHRTWIAYLYILPAFAIYAFFILRPIAETLRISFYEWDGLTKPVFNGFNNYIELVQDNVLRLALWNNLLFMVFYTVFPIAIALFLTVLLTRTRVRGLSFFRAGLFIPQVMAMVAVGVVWRWIYNPTFGPLNQTLQAIGLGALARPWLGNFDLALPAVGIAGTWVQYGFCMVLFIAGVQHIDEALYEAAKMDGANEFAQFINVTLPGIRAEISIAMVTTLIAALRIFDLVYVTTRGAPGMKTMVASLWLYRNAFQINRVGYAGAIAVVLTSIILGVSYFVLTTRSKGDD